MNKNILLKYISGQATTEEKNDVLMWVSKSDKNEKYFIRLMNFWISQNLPEEKASKEEYLQIKKIIDSKKKTNGYFINKKSIWIAAASVLLLIALNIYYIHDYTNQRKSLQFANVPDNIVTTSKNIKSSKVLYTERGVKARIILPDSSVVYLNSDSKIVYPDKFDTELREVSISGEAYFDVVKEENRPMIVSTNKRFKIKVTGTKFNIKSYDNDNQAQTTLYSGVIDIIRVSRNNKMIITKVFPNETITINQDNSCVRSLLHEPESLSAWKDGKILFEETPMREVIKILERWHGVNFIVSNTEILDYKITANFDSESIVQIMDLIKMTSFIDYKIEGNKVILKKR